MISWNPAALHITAEELAEELATTKPRIALGAGGGGRGRNQSAPGTTAVSITAWMMQPGEDKIVADRIYEVLSRSRSPKSSEMHPAAADLSGRWDVAVEFFSSNSRHSLFLEQKGNRIQGSHKGDFLVRELFGTVEGDQVKLVSTTAERGSGDSITFIFAGTLSGDAISGRIHMGEYLTAKFSANRHSYPAGPGTIRVPVGPPLAN
jgi:hypothetical protein